MRTDFDPTRLTADQLIAANDRKADNRAAWENRAYDAYKAGNQAVYFEIIGRLNDRNFQ